MKSKMLALGLFYSIMSSGATELEFSTGDGSEYKTEKLPELIVTEHLKQQGKLIQDGKLTKQWGSYGKCQEVWQTEEQTIICGQYGIWIYDDENTREIFFEPKVRPLEIHSCQPLDDGGLLVGVNKAILELNPEGKIKKMIKIPYLRDGERSQMKTVRKLEDGGYLISDCGQNKVYFLNQKGMVIRTIDLNRIQLPHKLKKIHGVELLRSGNVLIGTGYGASLIEVDLNDKVVWSLLPEDLPELGLKYVGGFTVRGNGNIVVAAYNSAYPMFEVDRNKQIVWKVQRNKQEGIDRPTSVNFVVAGF